MPLSWREFVEGLVLALFVGYVIIMSKDMELIRRTLEGKLKDLEIKHFNELRALESQFTELSKGSEKLKTELAEVQKRNFDDINKINFTLEELQTKYTEGQNKTYVAFSAYNSDHLTPQRNPPLNVVFDKTWINTATVYDTATGLFTAPSVGLYVFSVGFLVPAKHIFDIDFVVNGGTKGYCNCNNESGTGYEICSKTIPLILQTGDRVNIRKTHGNYLHGHGWSSFHGWKVH